MVETTRLGTTAETTAKPASTRATTPQRVIAIDLLRALTMVLMIFVNDLWSLQNIPAWLGHVESGVDGIGLADIVFPAFLFIVGLSLPFSVSARRLKGDTDGQLILHVLWRAFALLVMGVFLVNGETINGAATGVARLVWNPVCCLCFILIWNNYPQNMNKYLTYGLRGAAIVTLITFAIIYRGGEDGTERFAVQWWGILGLIGWAYLVSGIVTVLAKDRMPVIVTVWLFFCALSMLYHANLVPEFLTFIPNAILGGTLTGLTLGGVLTALIFQRFKGQNAKLTYILLAFSAVLILASVITRPYWGLAKLGATPAWLFLCSAFTILGFLVIYWIADVYRKEKWFSIIKPAGTATLLCYLIPYFAYSTMWLLGINLPEFMLIGAVGLIKSFLFAILCAVITGFLLKGGLRFRV